MFNASNVETTLTICAQKSIVQPCSFLSRKPGNASSVKTLEIKPPTTASCQSPAPFPYIMKYGVTKLSTPNAVKVPKTPNAPNISANHGATVTKKLIIPAGNFGSGLYQLSIVGIIESIPVLAIQITSFSPTSTTLPLNTVQLQPALKFPPDISFYPQNFNRRIECNIDYAFSVPLYPLNIFPLGHFIGD